MRHRHGNRTHVFVKVSLSNICQPPNYRLLLLRRPNAEGRTNSEGECAAAQNEDADDSEAAVRHKDSRGKGGQGRRNFSSRYERVELDAMLFEKKNRLWSPLCSVNSTQG